MRNTISYKKKYLRAQKEKNTKTKDLNKRKNTLTRMSDNGGECNRALFVANLSTRVSPRQLSELFEKKGTVGKLGTLMIIDC